MKKQFNYDNIVKGILDGTVKQVNFVFVQHKDLNTDNVFDASLVFAGTTDNELKEAFSELVRETQVKEDFEEISIIAATAGVQKGYIDEYDSEVDDTEEVIEELMQWIYGRGNYDIVDEEYITHDYECLEGAILVNWCWDTYVGYARTFKSLEYCTDGKMTAKECMPIDKAFESQCTCLVSASEIKEIASATDLCAFIETKLKGMGKWKTFPDVESVVRLFYTYAELYPILYNLPANDLKDED